MITPILILNGKLANAVALKQALERSPRIEVHPFTTPDAAVEYAREHPQDAALIDLPSLGAGAAYSAIQGLRAASETMLIIVTPPPGDEYLQRLGADAALPVDFRPADLLRLVDSWGERNTTPMTAKLVGDAPSAPSSLLEHIFDDSPPMPDTLPEQPATLEAVLRQIGENALGIAPPGTGNLPHDDDSYFDGGTPADPQSSGQGADVRAAPRTSFDALVESLRREPAPLSSRLADFIIKDAVDDVIGPPAAPAPTRPERPARYSADSQKTFATLAADEPPQPTVAQGATISELISGAHDKGFQKVLAILRGEAVSEESSKLVPAAAPNDPDDSGPIIIASPRPQVAQFDFDAVPSTLSSTARIILEEAAYLPSTEAEFSIEALLDSIEGRLPSESRLKPMPQHVLQQAEERWRAARMLAEAEAQAEAEAAESAASGGYPASLPEGASSDQTTRASSAQQFETHPENMETEWLDPSVMGIDATRALPAIARDALAEPLDAPASDDDARSAPFTTPPDMPLTFPETPAPPLLLEPDGTEAEAEWYTEDFNTQFERMAAFDLPRGGIPAPLPVDRTAQAALALTHAALDTTAEAALLLRDGQIAAQAGRMAADELVSLQPIILGAQGTNRRDARVQFVTQAETGRDYLLYTCATEAGMLTLIFRGTTSLSDIRRQGARLAEALQAVPEPAPIITPPPAPAPMPETTVREPFAYVWLLRDPDQSLDEPGAKAIGAGLATQLSEIGWKLHDLRVEWDHVYVYADVPGDELAFRVVRNLKARSAAILHTQNPSVSADTLWADSYLIVTPGRPLEADEIQQFVNFERL